MLNFLPCTLREIAENCKVQKPLAILQKKIHFFCMYLRESFCKLTLKLEWINWDT